MKSERGVRYKTHEKRCASRVSDCKYLVELPVYKLLYYFATFPKITFTNFVTSAMVMFVSWFTSAAEWLYVSAVSLPRIMFTNAVTSAMVMEPS